MRRGIYFSKGDPPTKIIIALVAQGIEHSFPKAGVAGSIPAGGAFQFQIPRDSCRSRGKAVLASPVIPLFQAVAPPLLSPPEDGFNCNQCAA